MIAKTALFAASFLLCYVSGWFIANLFHSHYTPQDKIVFAAMSAGLTIAGICLHIHSQKSRS